jgi:hypothetical protein
MVEALQSTDPSNEEAAAVRRSLMDEDEAGRRSNAYWLGAMTSLAALGEDEDDLASDEPTIAKLVIAPFIRMACRHYLDIQHSVQFTSVPASSAP